MDISLAAADAAADAVTALIDATSPPGTIRVYTGAAPATPELAPTGTLLVDTTFSNPAFNPASGGTAIANAVTPTTVLASGTAGYARVYDGAGVCICNLTVGTSAADVIFSTLSLISGDPLTFSSVSYTQPGL